MSNSRAKGLIVTVNKIAECLRTDCNILGDTKKKKNFKSIIHPVSPSICPGGRAFQGVGCCRWIVGIAGSNPTGGMDVRRLCLPFVVYVTTSARG